MKCIHSFYNIGKPASFNTLHKIYCLEHKRDLEWHKTIEDLDLYVLEQLPELLYLLFHFFISFQVDQDMKMRSFINTETPNTSIWLLPLIPRRVFNFPKDNFCVNSLLYECLALCSISCIIGEVILCGVFTIKYGIMKPLMCCIRQCIEYFSSQPSLVL